LLFVKTHQLNFILCKLKKIITVHR